MQLKALLLSFSTLVGGTAYAQSNPLNTKVLEDMSLEELMNVKVVSASKKAENLFDAPLSASVLTRDEIQKAGATSIMEALRLMPGLIVRETTNGNYNVYIRGQDNTNPNTPLPEANNTTTLVMIDNRPVFSYGQGGTFWESLPIDFSDVEKIEVVRGAAATLYGPNAVSGVINILTRKTSHKGWNALANAQYGSLKTALTNASLGYQFSDQLSVTMSGNYQGRGRQVSYYRPDNGKFYQTPDSLLYMGEGNSAATSFPHPDRSMDRYGANLFVHYTPSEKNRLSIATGLQDSKVQDATYGVLLSSLTTLTSRTGYLDVKANLSALSTQVSYLSGTQNPVVGQVGGKYNFATLDAGVEYEVKAGAHLSIKPGLSYRQAVFDDTPYIDASKKGGVINARRSLETYSASLRADYRALGDKLRLMGGIRIDQFNYPDKPVVSFQVAPSYKLFANLLLRANYSRAYRSPFIYSTFMDMTLTFPMGGPGIPNGSLMKVNLLGNRYLDLLQLDMFELGYRAKLADNLSLDVEGYHTTTKNYNVAISGETTVQPGATPSDPILLKTTAQFTNLPLAVRQLGVTVSVNYVQHRLQVKPFLTWQTTTLRNYSPYANTSQASPSPSNGNNPASNNYLSGQGTERRHQFTPTVYGGAFINYSLSQKLNLNLNLNPYFYSAQTFLHSDNLIYNDGNRGVQHMDAKLILNASLTYAPTKLLSAFATVKNLLNDNSREYYKTDQMGTRLLVGLRVQY